jgi:hypothetical protein
MLFYQMLVDSSNPLQSETASEHRFVQTRSAPVKEGWISEGPDRLHFRLGCSAAELSIIHKDRDIELLEHLKDLDCLMQEQLYFLLGDGTELVRARSGEFFLRSDREGTKPVRCSPADLQTLKPMQRVRHLSAQDADYHYNRGLITSKHVQLQRLVLAGHMLIPSVAGIPPLMTGVADSLEMTFTHQRPVIRAKRFRANILSSKGGLQ